MPTTRAKQAGKEKGSASREDRVKVGAEPRRSPRKRVQPFEQSPSPKKQQNKGGKTKQKLVKDKKDEEVEKKDKKPKWNVEKDLDWDALKTKKLGEEESIPFPQGERGVIKPQQVINLACKIALPSPASHVFEIDLGRNTDDPPAFPPVPKSTGEDDPLIEIRLSCTAEEYARKHIHKIRFLNLEVAGDFRILSSDGILLALHLRNALGFLLGDQEKGLEEAERMGMWIEKEVEADGGAPKPAPSDDRHEEYDIKNDKRKGATHLFNWTPKGHDNPALLKPSSDCARDYISRLGENLNLAFEAVLKSIYAADAGLYKDLTEESEFAARINNPFMRHQGLVLVHNLPSDPHLDPLDSRRIVTMMMPVGKFVGGQLTFEGIGVKSEYRAGDLVFIRPWLVKHGVLGINNEDVRHGLIYVWQERITKLGKADADWEYIAAGKGEQTRWGPTSKDAEARRAGDAEAAMAMAAATAVESTSGKGKGKAPAEEWAPEVEVPAEVDKQGWGQAW